MSPRLLVVVVAAALLVASVCVSARGALRHPLTHVRRLGAAEAVPVLIAVAQRVRQLLADTCANVSTPRHTQYGQYLSLEQVAELVGDAHHLRAVVTWLRRHQATHVEVVPTNDFVRANLPASVAEKVFNFQLHLFRHSVTKKLGVRSSRPYTLPAELRGHVDHVVGVEPVNMAHPSSTMPLGVHAPRMTRRLSKMASVGEVQYLAQFSGTDLQIEMLVTCADHSTAKQPFPCSGTKNPITAFTLAVAELKSAAAKTFSITPANAATYNVTHFDDDQGDSLYMMTFVGAAPQFGHFQFNLSFTAQSGGSSAVVAYPAPVDGLEGEPFVVNTLAGVPSFFHTLYNVPNVTATAAGLTQAMAAFSGQCYAPKSLKAFLETYNLPATTDDVTIAGYNSIHSEGIETMLDLEMELAMAPNVHTYYIYTGKGASSEDFILEWGANISAWTEAPLLHSISYGLPESEMEEAFGIPADEYASRVNAELQKICVRGITVLVASGDAGSTSMGHGSQTCAIIADFPASSPWITAVGATALDNEVPAKTTGAVGEVVVSIPNGQQWTTGGGFSSLPSQTQPAYQKTAVAAFLKTAAGKLPDSSVCNAGARAYPDIAALGDNIMIFASGALQPVGGTSASSPMTAGILSHLNAARIAAGKSSIGFFNPLLYTVFAEHPEVFYDVTVGEISCGDSACCPVDLGYPAVKGYDTASGVGTIADATLLTKYILEF